MGYHVNIFRREVEANHAKAGARDFFENAANLLPFSTADHESLTEALTLRGFVQGKKDKRGIHFSNEELGADALLTAVGLYLSAHGEDATFEILMMGSELADEQLAKFDPQLGDWE